MSIAPIMVSVCPECGLPDEVIEDAVECFGEKCSDGNHPCGKATSLIPKDDYDRYRATLEDVYACLTDAQGLGPDVTVKAVEQAREYIAKALIP